MGFKMISSCEILVLIVDDQKATLCANSDGVTRLLRTIDRFLPANDAHRDAGNAFDAGTFFACRLTMALCRYMSERTYDGVVIFAQAPMMEELRKVQTSAISRVLIAEIIGMPSEFGHFPGCSATNAELIYRGALR
jgi:hypothetical protein